jgi:glycosyltransferase involved in cell wall biosynthesis
MAALPHVVLFTASYEMRGMEEHIVQLGAGLAERGVRTAVVCDGREGIRPLREALARDGVEVHAIPERRGARLGTLWRFRALVEALRRHPGCIVHGHYSAHWGGDLLLAAARLAGTGPLVRTEHNAPILPTGRLDRLRVAVRDRGYARVIYVSEQNRDEFLRHLGRRPEQGVVVPNGVDAERFSPAAVPPGAAWGGGGPVVGTVSSLSEERKGVAHFLEMAAAVARRVPAARFVVAGDGVLRPRLEAMAGELGIVDRVVFTGRLADVRGVLSSMRVFVLPSLFEGCPYSLLEAMAMARPVVATAVGSVPEVVEDGGSGLLVRPADPDALARAVCAVLEDAGAAERMGRRGREIIVGRYAVSTMVDAILDVYESVSGRGRSFRAGRAGRAAAG